MSECRLNRRMAVEDARGCGLFKLRVYHRKAHGRLPRFLVKCGCCREALTICYSKDSLEIGGVVASLEEWGKLLMPLLRGETPEM